MDYKDKKRREKEIERLKKQIDYYDDEDTLNKHWTRAKWFIEWKLYILENME